jgi:hypothetical protein
MWEVQHNATQQSEETVAGNQNPLGKSEAVDYWPPVYYTSNYDTQLSTDKAHVHHSLIQEFCASGNSHTSNTAL